MLSTSSDNIVQKTRVFTSRVLMVEPSDFYLNEETSADNKFMT